MRCQLLVVLFLLPFVVTCAPSGDSSAQVVRLVLPEGNVEAGRQTFINLKCTVCHTVTGAQGLPAAVSQEPGPDLGVSLAGVSRGAVATSIITPQHVNVEAVELWTDLSDEERVWLGPGLIPPRQGGERRPSRMGEYADITTVRQLTDLVTFLHSTSNPD